MQIDGTEVGEIPESSADRMKDLLALPLSKKQSLIPPVGYRFQMGPFVFEVTLSNPYQLRIAAKMVDVVVEESKIIKPEIKIA